MDRGVVRSRLQVEAAVLGRGAQDGRLFQRPDPPLAKGRAGACDRMLADFKKRGVVRMSRGKARN